MALSSARRLQRPRAACRRPRRVGGRRAEAVVVHLHLEAWARSTARGAIPAPGDWMRSPRRRNGALSRGSQRNDASKRNSSNESDLLQPLRRASRDQPLDQPRARLL